MQINNTHNQSAVRNALYSVPDPSRRNVNNQRSDLVSQCDAGDGHFPQPEPEGSTPPLPPRHVTMTNSHINFQRIRAVPADVHQYRHGYARERMHQEVTVTPATVHVPIIESGAESDSLYDIVSDQQILCIKITVFSGLLALAILIPALAKIHQPENVNLPAAISVGLLCVTAIGTVLFCKPKRNLRHACNQLCYFFTDNVVTNSILYGINRRHGAASNRDCEQLIRLNAFPQELRSFNTTHLGNRIYDLTQPFLSQQRLMRTRQINQNQPRQQGRIDHGIHCSDSHGPNAIRNSRQDNQVQVDVHHDGDAPPSNRDNTQAVTDSGVSDVLSRYRFDETEL